MGIELGDFYGSAGSLVIICNNVGISVLKIFAKQGIAIGYGGAIGGGNAADTIEQAQIDGGGGLGLSQKLFGVNEGACNSVFFTATDDVLLVSQKVAVLVAARGSFAVNLEFDEGLGHVINIDLHEGRVRVVDFESVLRGLGVKRS